MTCSELEAPENGIIQCSDILVGDICIFQCNPGFVLSGDASRTCQSDQTWSGMKATCAQGCLL